MNKLPDHFEVPEDKHGGLRPKQGPKRTSREVRFFVEGEPATKGSWKPSRHGGFRNDCESESRWAQAVMLGASMAMMGEDLFDGDVDLQLDFYLIRGPSVKRQRPSVKPDWDKLSRSVSDSLTGFAYTDDARIVEARVRKFYAEKDSPTGVEITVREL